ncbi:hypothetical protein DTL70_25720 [Streptomyces diacarni]|uniref:DUF8175 domain-containing protein n=1 Tax=Streptomyces diacarni TaxID=2800381 RepID=A0A367ENL9_9ACTN|nr:hypothetical protein [Streptomyces diacarni]RCG18997.1 hypothetical protein DTL70_25720 [Streptomyces diacarni]
MNIGGGDEYDGRTRTSDYAPGASEGSRTTTRTRLPGNEAGGSGGRPPSRPGRSLITVVAVVVLLIAAIAFANRGGGGGEDGGAASDDSRGGDSRAQPTAPTGEKPVKNSSDTTIPSGFAHTEQGAQSAAANYAVALVSADMMKKSQRDAIVQRLFVPAKVDETQRKMDKAYSSALFEKIGLDKNGAAKSGAKFVSRTAPVGTSVREYKKSSARLAVWCTGVFGNAGKKSTNPVRSDWFTLSLDLKWTDGDWKVQDFSQKEGPAPVNGDNTASSADEISDAVEKFGGFTYAR